MRGAARHHGPDLERLLPGETAFDERLRAWAYNCADRWHSTESHLPTLPATFDPVRQRGNEINCDKAMDLMENQLRSIPGPNHARTRWRLRLLGTIRLFAERTLCLAGDGLDLVLSDECVEVTRSFLREAHAFDENLAPADLSQALRNVWVMNCLQMLLGLRPALTPSVLAYSLLYPYTDNYLDQPGAKQAAKAAFNRRLSSWLRGIPAEPVDPREESVCRLLGMIEGEFPRESFPGVHLSLLAIQRGQIKSLRQQRVTERLDSEELLAISIEKGGASVLADGYLVSGSLSEDDARFCFELGVFLQLADDLQDLKTDLACSHQTIFSRSAGLAPLDEATRRLLRFLRSVLASSRRAHSGQRKALRELLERNSVNLVLRSVAHCREFFTDAFVRQMECYSPLRFDYLRRAEPLLETRLRQVEASLRNSQSASSFLDFFN